MKVTCPFCSKDLLLAFAVGANGRPTMEAVLSAEVMPIVCDGCAGIFLLWKGNRIEKPSELLIEGLRQAPIWEAVIALQAGIRRNIALKRAAAN